MSKIKFEIDEELLKSDKIALLLTKTDKGFEIEDIADLSEEDQEEGDSENNSKEQEEEHSKKEDDKNDKENKNLKFEIDPHQLEKEYLEFKKKFNKKNLTK